MKKRESLKSVLQSPIMKVENKEQIKSNARRRKKLIKKYEQKSMKPKMNRENR
jgi:hypothetical protein